MNERHLRRLLHHIVWFAAPLPALAVWTGCGGATMANDDDPRAGSGGADSGSAGSPSMGGAPAAGTPGVGGANAGSLSWGGVSGTGAAAAGGGIGCLHLQPPNSACSPWVATVPKSCVPSELTVEECRKVCGSFTFSPCSVLEEMAGQVAIQCAATCVEGRRPAGFVEHHLKARGLGAHFARAAELEAASVFAFRQLRGQLRAHGAPRALLSKLSRAARDERRHTRTTCALARRFGGTPRYAQIATNVCPSIEEIAMDNVVEGCIRETYGALVATWQAREARDPEIRAAMQRIAREETSHAALSFELQRWLERRLHRTQLQRVEAAKRRALGELRAALELPHEMTIAEIAGLPSVARSRELFASLTATLWRS